MSRVCMYGLASVFLAAATAAAQDTATPESSVATTDAAAADLFPPELETWLHREPELIGGLKEADALRAKLLSVSPSGETYGDQICELVLKFQTAVEQSNLLGSPVRDFNMSVVRLSGQLSGKDTIAPDAFDQFDGRWFGRWDKMNVNHDWRPSETFNPPKILSPNDPPLAALQYAWVSNGFGWNYLCSLDGSGKRNFVLGMVYYFEAPDYQTVTGKTALVGFADSPTRLVWITEKELYLEEVFPDQQRYVITSLKHHLFCAKATVESEAVQATYTRDPGIRPEFRKFHWNVFLTESTSDE